jgi:dihydroorotate dehydrogenase electron transfer subunit
LFIIQSEVVEKRELPNKIFLLRIYCPEIAPIILPGQFLNIRVSDQSYPLLRRPFSVCDVQDDSIFIMFNIYGEGTKLIAGKSIGDKLDILGPLGNGFNLSGDYDTAVIAAGGLGAAPFPYLTKKLENKKNIISFIGGKTYKEVITYGMINVSTSSDDGSTGFKGNVVELLNSKIDLFESKRIKIFGCGPTPMLKALQKFSIDNNFDCEISTECVMACGFGICQGCPIDSTNDPDNFLLVCKDGPVFNVKDILL